MAVYGLANRLNTPASLKVLSYYYLDESKVNAKEKLATIMKFTASVLSLKN